MKTIHFPRWLRKLLRRRMLISFLIIVQAAFFIYLVASGSMLSQRLSRALTIISILVVLYIYPRVVGAKINLPAMWVLAAITVGGNLAGPFGMLLGVPAASAAYALLREATENREKRLAHTQTE